MDLLQKKHLEDPENSSQSKNLENNTTIVQNDNGKQNLTLNTTGAEDTLDIVECIAKEKSNKNNVITSVTQCDTEKSIANKVDEKHSIQNSQADISIIEDEDEDDSKKHCKIIAESTTKNDSIIKRKRRNLSTQETTTSLFEENGIRSKRKKVITGNDKFCWRCHKESIEVHCSACPRSWHRRCIGGTPPTSILNWICGECATILRAENAETRSTTMAHLSVDQLCMLLKYVVQRMRDYPGSEPFWKPVEVTEAPNYSDYVVKPMDLSLLESNVRAKLYGSTDAFMADAKWIQHNCIVFNTCGGVYADISKLTNAAKQIIKLARQEVSEIEACPDCYAHGRNLPRSQPLWFIEPCRHPHPLVWAKLKGFPFWPAKAMPRINSQGFVDVRFFGEHDRAWVSPKDLYLYSENPPAPLPRKRKLDMDECVREITRHCQKLELAFGQFQFAPPKVQYNPHDPMQIKLMLPDYNPLQPNNSVSLQCSTSKKKAVLRKREQIIKSKSDTDSTIIHISDDSTAANSSSTICIEDTKSKNKTQKVDKLYQSEQCNSSNLADHTSLDSHIENSQKKEAHKNEEKTSKQDIILMDETENDDENTKLNQVKIDDHNEKTVIQNYNSSNVCVSRNSNLQKMQNNVKIVENSLKRKKVDELQKKSPVLKHINNKSNASNTSNILKAGPKSIKNLAKVYKPKTRMVDKVNAEKALKSVNESENEQKVQSESTLSNAEVVTTIASSLQSNTSESANNSVTYTMSQNKISTDTAATVSSLTTNLTNDQTVALLFLVNNGVESIKQSTLLSESRTKTEQVSPIIKQMQQGQGQGQKSQQEYKKDSKARKSFSSKPSMYTQVSPLLSSTTTESSIGYQLLPPEAGPFSARLYHDAEELIKRMAQLMEEAYKEAAHKSQDCVSDTSDSHHATIHFLRLQIERMRWQHQQQLAELKHNTDRILREVKASLEAERIRAIEETRREAEEEKVRCVEETKRKQWCAVCHHEALFYCCWNTAYCDYACQQSHWPAHMRTCGQKPSFTTIVTNAATDSNQQQNSNAKICNPSCRVYTLPHKSSGVATSVYVSCSKNEGDQDCL